MYDNYIARTRTARPAALVTAVALTLVISPGPVGGGSASGQVLESPSVVRKISSLSDKMELITNTSRILTLDKNIPRVQVNNPDLIAVTPLSANQVQISAKKAGVTQVNLWDEDGTIHTVDVLIYGDVQELQVALQTQFPNSSIKVFRYSESLVLKGFVDQPGMVSPPSAAMTSPVMKEDMRLAARNTNEGASSSGSADATLAGLLVCARGVTRASASGSAGFRMGCSWPVRSPRTLYSRRPMNSATSARMIIAVNDVSDSARKKFDPT